jgi:putative aldouronate transport system permease protein
MKNGSKTFNVINITVLAIISLVTLLPFLIVIAVSFTEEAALAINGFQLIPQRWSLAAYNAIGKGAAVFTAYKISFIITIFGTLGAITITALMAYALSRKCLKYRNMINMIVYIPLVFSGGLVPFYITLLKLNLQDNLFGLIVPLLFNPFNFFLMLNFFRSLPDAVIESAKIDGAGEFRIFRSIVFYLALPGIATITLFYSLTYWNDWTLALYLIDDTKLYPLQYLLRMVMMRVTLISGMQQLSGSIPAESTKMATVMVTIGPIIFVYPFIQKYFIKGITIGAVKG